MRYAMERENLFRGLAGPLAERDVSPVNGSGGDSPRARLREAEDV